MTDRHDIHLAGAWLLGIDFFPAIHRTPRSSRLSWAFFLLFCGMLVGSTILWFVLLLLNPSSSAADEVPMLIAAAVLRSATLASYVGTVRLMHRRTFIRAIRHLWRERGPRKWISRLAVVIPIVGLISLPLSPASVAQVQCNFSFAPQPRGFCLGFASVDYWVAYSALCAALLVIVVHAEALTLVVQQQVVRAVHEVQQEWGTPSNQLVDAALEEGIVFTVVEKAGEMGADGSATVRRPDASGAKAVARVHHAYAICVTTAEAISSRMLGLMLAVVTASIVTTFLVALFGLYTTSFGDSAGPTTYLWAEVAACILFASVLGWRLVAASRRADVAIRGLSTASGLPATSISALQQLSLRLPVAVRVGDLFFTHRLARRLLAGALAGVAPLVLKRLVGPT